MKKSILLILFITTVIFGNAQTFEQPKDGAKIYLSENEVGISTGEEATIDVWVVRSKRAKKSKFDAPKFLGSSDLDIQIVQDPNDANHFIATVKTTGVKNGKYFYTVSSRSRSIQKVTGTTVTINVGSNAVTKNN